MSKNQKHREASIGELEKVRCPWCSDVNTAKDWNDTTYAECVSREMRRAFIPIYNKAVWGKNSDNYYKCPKCSMWSRGNQLALLDFNGEVVKGMGGIPIVHIKKHDDTDALA